MSCFGCCLSYDSAEDDGEGSLRAQSIESSSIIRGGSTISRESYDYRDQRLFGGEDY